MPTHRRPSMAATAVVVPVPTNGSRTVPPGGENRRTTRLASSSGNSASCRELRATDRMFHTPREPHSRHSNAVRRPLSYSVMPGFQNTSTCSYSSTARYDTVCHLQLIHAGSLCHTRLSYR